MISASAPAKIILLGEHAVVYGQPAIAVPVSSVRATATALPNEHGLQIVAPDLNQILDLGQSEVDHALALLTRLVLNRINHAPPRMTITVASQIPLASGLGSGAAVSTALARVLLAATAQPIELETLNSLVYEVEKVHHGTPSGIDNTVIVYEQPVYFVREQPIERLRIGGDFTLLIGDTGKTALTKIAVGDVRALYNEDPAKIQPILNSIGTLVKAGRNALETGDAAMLGGLMVENHRLLQQLTVSSPELDALVSAALAAGALGAKLSGGGRGGNMIALITPDQADMVERALRAAGAIRVFRADLQRSPDAHLH
jgi:mevalonate kinase